MLTPFSSCSSWSHQFINLLKVSSVPPRSWLFGVCCLIGFLYPAQVLSMESQSRTESNCTIGMVKDDPQAECQVPIPPDCTVAQFPGYEEPWADVSKGGGTSCQFNENKTDWKTKIVGTCETCKTDQCTGRFIVMFNCSGLVPPADPGSPPRR